MIIGWVKLAKAQQPPEGVRIDTPKNNFNVREKQRLGLRTSVNPFFVLPENIKREVTYDPVIQRYIITEKVGNRIYSLPQYLTVEQYLRLVNSEIKRNNWRILSNDEIANIRRTGIIPSIRVNSRIFEKIFGGTTIDVQPSGEAELTFLGRVNKNENPIFSEKQKVQTAIDFNQRIQMDLVGNIGTKMKLKMNYNTEAQFNFENQIKLEYTGGEDDIIKKIEAGNVNLPLNTTLINGTQTLFGVKAQLQFGKLGISTVFSQQKSQSQELKINNGAQQNEFSISGSDYETNKHYFLAQYFRNTYNQSLTNAPVITSGVQITKIEVWITNKVGNNADSRDVLAFMDLGENNPYNTALITGGKSVLPSGFNNPNFPPQSNNLLTNLPPGARQTNSNDIITYFQANGGTDNFAKMIYARKLAEKEFTFHSQLGYISLNIQLNNDEVLAAAYRYTLSGKEYQVGEFSTDVPQDQGTPKVLFAKLLKNETTKTKLPTWNLMMKNIYNIGGYSISSANFKLDIFRLDDNTGIERPVMMEGQNTQNKLFINILQLDRLNRQKERKPDGFFDFETENSAFSGTDNTQNNSTTSINPQPPTNNAAKALFVTNAKRGYITIDPLNGRVIFPIIEPFGKDLADKFNQTSEQILIDKYTYPQLYDSVKLIAQQLFPNKNRYFIKGNYQSEITSEFSLNSINVPEGSVKVYAGSLLLVEGLDYTVDYQAGRVRLMNTALLASGQPIRISMESNETFGLQQRSLIGLRADYRVNSKLNIGGTFMNLTEKPISAKVNYGEEPISNKMLGLDVNYNSSSRFLTKMIDKLPLISTKEKSTLNFYGEFAQLIPGHPSALNFAGQRGGASYLDDFESTRSVIDIKNPINWQISGTPQFFPESQLTDNLAYGYNRAKLAFYAIDPAFYKLGVSQLPASLLNDKEAMSNHYVRLVQEQEVFPFKEINVSAGQTPNLPTLNLAFYPMLRGPYNYTTTGFNRDGTLQNPKGRWGGIMRRIDINDFEANNIEYIELWIMDPFMYKQTSQGGELYINIGNISEDILKDGRKSLENGLPATDDPTKYDETNWGRIPKLQPVTPAFDNNPNVRKAQDVGLDGLSDANERIKFRSVIELIKAQLNPEAANAFEQDPSSDNYSYFRGSNFDQQNAGILQRYQNYNGTEGNAKTSQQSIEELGLENSASTSLPDAEDINRDNNMTQSDEYFQYRVSIKPEDLAVGKNFVSDKVVSTVKLANGHNQNVTWYQIRIPLVQYHSQVGGIQDFKSIRFMRMFMTNFIDTAILRFAKLQFIRGEWRRYNPKNEANKVIADPSIQPANPDKSTMELATVNIEENGRRLPIPYVVPPGIERERNFSNYRGDTKQNEQSLAITIKNLRNGYGRAAFKTTINDFRSYKRLEVFIHAEALDNLILNDNDLQAFIRIGTDNQDNYYEYNQPLKVTLPGSRDPELIWPKANRMNIELALFQQAKLARNNAKTATGMPWPINMPFTYSDGQNQIVIKGQPDMSKVRVYMLGIKNPIHNAALSANDDELDKSAIIWFNEMRLTGFDERSAWAATARVTAKLADFADLNVSASNSAIGFGSLEKKVSERNKTDNVGIDVSSNIELGKFLPAKTGVKIPMFISYSKQVLTPQFDPRTPDIELKNALNKATRKQRDSLLNFAQDYTTRSSLAFTNVRKERSPTDKKIHLWDIENFNVSYAQTNFNHRDFINETAIQRTYKASLAYNFSHQPKNYLLFEKLIKSNTLKLLRDFNFTLLPKSIHFRMDVDRFYSENTLRNNDPYNYIPISTTFSKNFLLSRTYGVAWDLTNSLSLDFDAINYSVVDEPDGRIEGLKRDTLWQNIKNLGRNTNYTHNISIRYNLPISKIPVFDWIDVATGYGTNFNWQTEPLSTLRNPDINLGNTIQNARTIKVNPSLDFVRLYHKFGAGDNKTGEKSFSFPKLMLALLTSLRNVKIDFSQTKGTFLPGYLPTTRIFGIDNITGAPGLGFVLGSQQDIRNLAASYEWITKDTLQTQLYVNTLREDFQLTGNMEPFPELRITLNASRNRTLNFSSNFKYDVLSRSFLNYTPNTTGDYSISTIMLKTAFSDKKGSIVSRLYNQFMANRQIVSQRLGSQNPNSNGINEDFADGYNKNSQDVMVASFLAAYMGKDAKRTKLSSFPAIPIPNWRINYTGLIKISFFAERFQDFSLRHGYLSNYNINGFNSLLKYEELGGFAVIRDANKNFLPRYQFSQVSLSEQFVPLIGIDARLKNDLSANFEFNRNRMLALSLSNGQLANLSENNVVLGLGYRTTKFRFPFGILKSVKMDNDMNFKLDVAIRDSKTVIYRPDITVAEVSSGAKNITLRPSIDYVLNQRFNVRLFYDSNITKPYTSQSFTTSFSNFGFSLRLTLN